MARVGASDIIAGLVSRGVPQHVAEGVVMNFQDESGLDTGIQEAAPRSGRGGFGLAQWTGPRRVALEQFAESPDARGRPIDDLGLQLDYFMGENAGAEKAAWQQVLAAKTAQDAAVAFVNEWERPAAEHAASRSAKYQGAGDSPSEGGARFGGTGLGDPADSPFAGSVAAGGVKGTSPYALDKTKTGKGDKYAEAAAKAIGGFGGGGGGPALGANGQAPQLPSVAPQALPSMAIVSQGGGGAADPAMLQAMLARLNQNRLWG